MAKDREPLTRKERLNRNILVGCLALGVIIGVASASLGPQDHPGPLTMFGEGPLPLSFVLPGVAIWAIIMPAIAWYWHRYAIDEHEAAAYRDGGYYAAYTYLVATPVWWLLWRGGLLPEPDGVAIYLAFGVIWSLVWLKKKYA